MRSSRYSGAKINTGLFFSFKKCTEFFFSNNLLGIAFDEFEPVHKRERKTGLNKDFVQAKPEDLDGFGRSSEKKIHIFLKTNGLKENMFLKEEKKLLNLCIGVAILGLGVLYFLGKILPLEIISIGKLKQMSEGSKVLIEGEINGLRKIKSLTVVDISDRTGRIEVILFEKNEGMRRGGKIRVEGRLTSFNKKLQIDAEKVAVL